MEEYKIESGIEIPPIKRLIKRPRKKSERSVIKKCSTCKIEKFIFDFYKNKFRKDELE